MTVQNSDTLKSYFNLRKVITPSNYVDLVDTIFAQSSNGEIGEHNHDDRYLQLSIANNISAVHTFSPSSYGPPFILGSNAHGQTVPGLKAEQLDRSISVSGLGLSGGGVLTSNRTITLTSSSNPGSAASILASSADGTLSLLKINAGFVAINSPTPTAKKIQIEHTFTDVSDYPTVSALYTTVSLPNGSTAWPYTTSQGMTVYPQYNVANITNAGYSTGVRDGSGNLNSVNGFVMTVNMGGSYSGTINQMYGLRFINSGVTEGSVTGTITNFRLISLDNVHKNSGNILGLVGIYIGPMTAGSVYSYAIQTTTGIISFGDDLEFSAAKSIKTTSSNNLTLAPGGDLIINPTGKDMLPSVGYDTNMGSMTKKFLTLHAAELWVETLVAANTMATIGGRILIGATTELVVDLAAGDTTIFVKHNEMANGDIAYMEENGNIEFIQVASDPSVWGLYYSYTITRNLDGTGANNWYAGTAVFNTGTTGDGFIDLYSFHSVKSLSQYGPTIVGNVRTSSTYNAWTEHWAIGNLNGLYGYGVNTYGVGLGKYGADHVVIDPTNGIRFRDVNNVVLFQVNTSYLYLGSQSARWLYITPTAIQFKDTTAVWMSLSAASLVLGYDGGGSPVISIDTTNGIQLKNTSGVNKFHLQGDGDLFIGENVSFAATTFMSVFVNAQTYNGESVSAGDVLLGDNSASKANILWDKSAGKLLFRGGTTSQAEITTTGAITAGGGDVVLDSNGIRMISNSPTHSTHQSVIWKNDTDLYVIGMIETQYDPTTYQVGVEIEAHAQSSYENRITLYSHNNMYDGVAIILEASDATAVDAFIDMRIDAISKFACYNTYNLSWQDLRISTGLVVGSSATDPGSGEIIATNRMYINETANVKSTNGLTINQGITLDEAISLKNSNVDHGMSTVSEVDTYGWFAPLSADGGMKIRGMTETIEGLSIHALITTTDTTKDPDANAAITLTASKKTGTTVGAMGSDENILVIKAYNDTKFIFDTDGDYWYSGNLQAYRNSTTYSGYIFVPLTTPLVSTSWDGDVYSTTAKTVIDLSTVFGVPAGVKSVLVKLIVRDSASAANECWIILGPTNTAGQGLTQRCGGNANNFWTAGTHVVPCDANGDIYYQIQASGSNTFNVYLEIWGYWI